MNFSKKSKIKNLIYVIGIISFITFIIPVFAGVINTGNVTGCIISILIIILAKNYTKLSIWYKNKIFKIIAIIISAIMAIAIICAAILSILMVKATLNAPPSNAAVIVLGCKVNGEQPSLMLEKRLKKALDYLNRNPNAVCIVSGGQGKNEGISEALCMYNYLTENNIDKQRIYMEDKSHNTQQNIDFSNEIIQENNLSTDIAIVTDGFHILRSSIIAQKQGLVPYAIASNTPFYIFPTYYVRELYALIEEIILK